MKTVISTQNAPAAIGPYSQGIQAGSLIITSGQLPIDPATGAFPATIDEQTRQSLTLCQTARQFPRPQAQPWKTSSRRPFSSAI